MRRKWIYVPSVSLHLLLIIIVSCHETFWLVTHGLTITPPSVERFSNRAEAITSAALAQHRPVSNPIRRALFTYLHMAGIDKGYGYFAPNVPVSYKLVFELHYSDGRVEYEVPGGETAAADLRLATLLDEIGRTRVDSLREYLLKMVARSIWREHPDVKTMRAILDRVICRRSANSSEEFASRTTFCTRTISASRSSHPM